MSGNRARPRFFRHYTGRATGGRAPRLAGPRVREMAEIDRTVGERSVFVDRATLGLTERQAQVLMAMPGTTAEIKERLGVTASVVTNAVAHLREKGFAVRRGRTWEATNVG